MRKFRLESSLSAPVPKAGEVRHTSLPDDFSGIRWEIGRMAKYVQDARKDPLVIDAARLVGAHYSRFAAEMSARMGDPVDPHNNKTLLLEGIDTFCRHYFFYCNDPANVEVMQTPGRMVRQTKVAKEALSNIMEPFYRAMEERDGSFDRSSYEPPQLFIGDCEEAISLELGMCAALDIVPVRFRFGGNGGTLHHVWGRVQADGQWWDSDITEPDFKLGDFSEFDAYDEFEVPF